MPHVLPLILRSRGPGRIKPRLGPLRKALQSLGNPENQFDSVLIVGSNGKGSTAAMLASILAAHDLDCGLYTSPHLVSVQERIRIRGTNISPAALQHHLAALEPHDQLTFFETLTAAAFLAFAEDGVECAVLEAGMGGRWDATRLAASCLAGLTNVGTDHGSWLGPDRSAIAADKGEALSAAKLGILGPGVDEAMLSPLAAPQAVRADELVALKQNPTGHLVASWNDSSCTLRCPLPGEHQQHNMHLALALAEAAHRLGLVGRLRPERVTLGLDEVRWPGRLSRHIVAGRKITVDCAHNLEATAALATYLSDQSEPPNLLFSCLDDKPLDPMARALLPHVGKVAVCPLQDRRSMTVDRLLEAFPSATGANNASEALSQLPDPVLATGSLRLVGELLELEDGA